MNHMIKVKKPLILIGMVLVCQMAGIVGAFFTTASITNWYAFLNKPFFSPPNWIFAPVWTTLYTLMGISLYRIVIAKPADKNKRNLALKIFSFHLVLNSLWSIIFFGFKNPGLAFLEILILLLTLILCISLFIKIDRIAGLLLIPYLAWVSFASILNLSIWVLNPTDRTNVFAQEFNYEKAYSDYSYTKDVYNEKLNDFNKKFDSYQKNPTLSLKEEARISLYNLSLFRHELSRTYLGAIRMRLLEAKSLKEEERNNAVSKISEEVKWHEERKNVFSSNDTLEDLVKKLAEEDKRYTETFTPILNLSLATIGYADVVSLTEKHQKIYESLKNESDKLISLNIVDKSLFERWYKDINQNFDTITKNKEKISESLKLILSKESYEQKKLFSNINEDLEPSKNLLMNINTYLYELETAVEEKR